MNRQYIGARYVPKIFDNNGSNEWVSGISYEPLTVVTYMMNSYTSKKAVPSNIGAPSLNPEYWVNIGNYVGLISQLTERVNALNENVTKNDDKLTSLIISVKEYGATGNGETDDTTAILNAVAVANEYHCTLFFPTGTYILNNTINVNGCNILSAKGVINYGGNDTCINITDGFNTVIEGLILYGQNSGIGMKAIGHLNFSTISHCLIKGFEYGIKFEDSWLCHIEDVICQENTEYGAYLTRAYNAVIERCSFLKSNINLLIQTEAGAKISGVDCSGANNYGLVLNGCKGVSVSDLYYEDSGTYKATSVIHTGSNSFNFCSFKGLKMGLTNEDVSYITMDGSNGAWCLHNIFEDMVITTEESSQTIFNLIDYSGYQRQYANTLINIPTYTDTVISIAKGNGSFNIVDDGTKDVGSIYVIYGTSITKLTSNNNLQIIDFETDASGNASISYPAGCNRINCVIEQIRDGSGVVYPPATQRYYDSQWLATGLPASTPLKAFLSYHLT